MKKLNPRSFFKKIKSTDPINRLLSKVYKEMYPGTKTLAPYFPNVDELKDDKSRSTLLTDHLLAIDPEFRLILIDSLRIVNNIADNESIKIIEELSKNKNKYIIGSEEKAYILSSENNIDKVCNYYIACTSIIDDATIIREFYKKNNWTRYEAKVNKDRDNAEDSDSALNDDSLDLLTIELNNSFSETLRDDIDNSEIETLAYSYSGMHLAYIHNVKDDSQSYYIVYIPEANEVMIKGKGGPELLYTITESYMRMAHYIDISPLTIAYDASLFKLKGDNIAPMRHHIMLKSWQVKTIELINKDSAQSLSIKLRTSIEYSGMIQMWQFLQTLGDIKDLHNYEVNKISILMEINDGNVDKGYDRLSINISKSGANLNMLYPTHRKAYQILLNSNISLGFVAEK